MPEFEMAEALVLLSGVVGIVALSVWPLFRNRAGMLAMQTASLLALSLHYALLSLETASLMNLLGAVQIGATVALQRQFRLPWLGYAMAGAMALAGIATWEGNISLLATIGMILVTLGRCQRDAGRLRLIVLAGGPFWLAHDILVASPVAIADALSLVFGAWSIWRGRHFGSARDRSGHSWPYPVRRLGLGLFNSPRS